MLMPSSVVIGIGVRLFLFVVISVVSAFLAFTCYDRIPDRHRKLDPALAWLLVIPCVSLVWNFWVFPRLAQSFRSYFDAQGVTNVGDCGEGLALGYCIASACCVVPCVGCLAIPASVILLVFLFVKFFELRGLIALSTYAER